MYAEFPPVCIAVPCFRNYRCCSAILLYRITELHICIVMLQQRCCLLHGENVETAIYHGNCARYELAGIAHQIVDSAT